MPVLSDNRKALLFSAALMVSLPFAVFDAPNALGAPQVGTSAAVRGDVLVRTGGASRKAQVRDAIRLQERVITRDDSALQILLLDRSTFTVGQNCNMVIDRFVYDPDTSAGQISAKVSKGAFRFMSGNIGKQNPTNAKVSTPSATIGVRGTFFEGIVGEDALALAQLGGVDTGGSSRSQASIVVLRGAGSRRNTLDNVGRIDVSSGGRTATMSEPNYAVFTPGNGLPPVGPFKVTPEMQDYLNFFLRSEPNGQGEDPVELDGTGSALSGQDLFESGTDTPDDVLKVPTMRLKKASKTRIFHSKMMTFTIAKNATLRFLEVDTFRISGALLAEWLADIAT